MSTIKVDTIATRTGSGNITASNTIAGNLTGNVTGNVTGNLTGNSTVGGTLGVTGLVTASAGVAIGGTGSANTLDDYEEGTWTPTVTRWTSNMSFSGSPHAVSGKYRKVGNLLHLHFYIQWATSSVTGNGSGGWRITGLPFSNYTSGDGNFLSVGYFYDGIDNKGESTTGDSARLQVNYSSGILEMYSKNATSFGTSGSWIIISASGTLSLA